MTFSRTLVALAGLLFVTTACGGASDESTAPDRVADASSASDDCLLDQLTLTTFVAVFTAAVPTASSVVISEVGADGALRQGREFSVATDDVALVAAWSPETRTAEWTTMVYAADPPHAGAAELLADARVGTGTTYVLGRHAIGDHISWRGMVNIDGAAVHAVDFCDGDWHDVSAPFAAGSEAVDAPDLASVLSMLAEDGGGEVTETFAEAWTTASRVTD